MFLLSYPAAFSRVFFMPDHPPPEPALPAHGVSFAEMTRAFRYIGLNSFGGSAGQIAVMHRVLVDEKRWISEARFLHALNLCMLLPGPEATQLAIYCGWLLYGVRGGIVAGVLFILPGFVVLLALSLAYTTWQGLGAFDAALFGLKATVLAVVVEAMLRIGRRVLKTRFLLGVSGIAFVAICFFKTPFPLIVAGAGALGFAVRRLFPGAFPSPAEDEPDLHPEIRYATDVACRPAPSAAGLVRTVVAGLAVWLVPVAALLIFAGRENIFAAQAEFFSKAATVTFGGAYAVLAYVAQQAVGVRGWLSSGEMLTGLGFAETTPGPLIIVLQFVGYMGAYNHPGAFAPALAGVIGSVVAVWATFAPCFLWIFAGAPFVENLRGLPALAGALACVTAAVVGVMLDLTVWLALQTLFATPGEYVAGPVHLPCPDWTTLNPAASLIAIFSGWVMLRRRWSLARTLCAGVGLGLAAHFLGPA